MQKYSIQPNSKVFWIHFTGTEIEALLQRMRINEFVFTAQNTHNVEKILRKMLDCIATKNSMTDDILNTHFITLLVSLQESESDTNSRIVRVINQMKSENFKGLSIEEYAKISGLSKYHFIRQFKMITNLSPHQYKAKILVDKAISLFNTTNMNISEVATALGFDDSFYFSRFFKKHTGESPKKYLKKA